MNNPIVTIILIVVAIGLCFWMIPHPYSAIAAVLIGVFGLLYLTGHLRPGPPPA